LLVRTGIVLVGFYVVAGGHWERLLLCLLGFVIAHFVVTRLTGSPVEHYNAPGKEAIHAP
jgi:F1F0 ATPase subunit 2